jgi:DNA-binding MarR family transcriptional regulator
LLIEPVYGERVALTPAAREAWSTLRDLLISGQGHDMFLGACSSIGLTPGPAKALLRLHDEPQQSMRDLAQLLGCDASYITALTDVLEQRGFAERRAHPNDRRARVVVLTEEGERAASRLLEAMSVPPESFGVLSAAEQATLRDLLRKVAAADRGATSSVARSA